MPNNLARLSLLCVLVLTGCDAKPTSQAPASAAAQDDVSLERSKLSAEDRTLVEAQEWCVISTDERLGSMGPPIKITVKGQTVFLCCSSCKRKAEANPDQTIAKLEEHKAKVKDAKK